MKVTRRVFLRRAVGSATVFTLAPLVACSSDGPTGDTGTQTGGTQTGGTQTTGGTGGQGIAAGNIADYASGDLVALVGERVAIGLDDQGLYALSTLCTHQQCDMARQGTVDSQGLFCACHGSDFDVNGAVVQGPARTDLPHYAVSLDAAGEIFIDDSMTVSADERTPVA